VFETPISVDPDSLKTIRNVKIGTARFIIMKMEGEDEKKAVIDKIGDHRQTMEDIISSLPKDDCRYAIYYFETEEAGKRYVTELFVTWLPRGTPFEKVEDFRRGKDLLRAELKHISAEYLAENPEQITKDNFGMAVRHHTRILFTALDA